MDRYFIFTITLIVFLSQACLTPPKLVKNPSPELQTAKKSIISVRNGQSFCEAVQVYERRLLLPTKCINPWKRTFLNRDYGKIELIGTDRYLTLIKIEKSLQGLSSIDKDTEPDQIFSLGENSDWLSWDAEQGGYFTSGKLRAYFTKKGALYEFDSIPKVNIKKSDIASDPSRSLGRNDGVDFVKYSDFTLGFTLPELTYYSWDNGHQGFSYPAFIIKYSYKSLVLGTFSTYDELGIVSGYDFDNVSSYDDAAFKTSFVGIGYARLKDADGRWEQFSSINVLKSFNKYTSFTLKVYLNSDETRYQLGWNLAPMLLPDP